jgi:hypothetical protein
LYAGSRKNGTSVREKNNVGQLVPEKRDAGRRRHNPRLSFVIGSGLCRSAHHRRNPGMFKGIGALPQRAKSGWVYTQTLLAKYVNPFLILFPKRVWFF